MDSVTTTPTMADTSFVTFSGNQYTIDKNVPTVDVQVTVVFTETLTDTAVPVDYVTSTITKTRIFDIVECGGSQDTIDKTPKFNENGAPDI